MTLLTAENVVGVGFLLFLAVLAFVGAHRKVVAALDARIDGVKKELAEAERLRAEAKALMDSFEARRKQAEAEAAHLVEQARIEAKALAVVTQQRMDEFVARRTKAAEDKIALAESQAANDVRSVAAEAAVKAAEQIIREDTPPALAASLVDKGIQEVARLRH